MPASIVADLEELMSSTLVAQPGSVGGQGDWVASGAALNLPCRISGRIRLIRDEGGREVVSSRQATVGSATPLTVRGHRYTLPAPHDPADDLLALAVKPVEDENGSHHTVVYLP